MRRTLGALMPDPTTEKWFRTMAKRSQITAGVNYLRRPAFSCQMKVEPVHSVELLEKKKAALRQPPVRAQPLSASQFAANEHFVHEQRATPRLNRDQASGLGEP